MTVVFSSGPEDCGEYSVEIAQIAFEDAFRVDAKKGDPVDWHLGLVLQLRKGRVIVISFLLTTEDAPPVHWNSDMVVLHKMPPEVPVEIKLHVLMEMYYEYGLAVAWERIVGIETHTESAGKLQALLTKAADDTNQHLPNCWTQDEREDELLKAMGR